MSQTYPAISPINAVLTPSHPITFSVVGLPAGVTIIQDSWLDEVTGADQMDGSPVATWTDEDGLGTGPHNTYANHANVDLSSGVTISAPYSVSSSDADYSPGTVIAPPPAANPHGAGLPPGFVLSVASNGATSTSSATVGQQATLGGDKD